jgi:hypothetical protein
MNSGNSKRIYTRLKARIVTTVGAVILAAVSVLALGACKALLSLGEIGPSYFHHDWGYDASWLVQHSRQKSLTVDCRIKKRKCTRCGDRELGTVESLRTHCMRRN